MISPVIFSTDHFELTIEKWLVKTTAWLCKLFIERTKMPETLISHFCEVLKLNSPTAAGLNGNTADDTASDPHYDKIFLKWTAKSAVKPSIEVIARIVTKHVRPVTPTERTPVSTVKY